MTQSERARLLFLGLAVFASVAIGGCKKANRDSGEVARAVESAQGTPNPGAGPTNAQAATGGEYADCEACMRDKCAGEAPGCQALKDPGKVALCEKLLACIKRTNCARQVAAHCWCGTTPIPECTVNGKPGNGACAAEEIAAAESVDSRAISQRYANNSYASGAANNRIICEQEACPAACGHPTPQL